MQCCSEPGSPRLALHTPNLSPTVVRLQFPGDTQMEECQLHLATVCTQVHSISGKIINNFFVLKGPTLLFTGKPSESSIWAVTNLGEIFVSNSISTESAQLHDNLYVQEIDLIGKEMPVTVPLYAGCPPGTELTLTGCVSECADRIAINLLAHSTYKARHKAHSEIQNNCLHLNPRLKDAVIVRNSLIEDKWGEEERSGGCPFKPGQEFVVKLVCSEEGFMIHVDDKRFCAYKHRLSPYAVSDLNVWGKLHVFKLSIKSPVPCLDPRAFFWRQLGGHLRRVETCGAGVTWGIGSDHTAWVYTGGWGGGIFGSLESHGVNAMNDSQDYRVYENQRWNPLSGYTSAGKNFVAIKVKSISVSF